MLISKKINDALNQQIGNEFESSLQYVAVASYFEGEALPQLAGFFFRQADEERDHAMRFVRFVLEAGGTVRIPAITAPQATYKKAADAVGLSLKQELKITAQINKLVDLAKKEQNYTTDTFLQWFVTEQLEEVSTMEALLKTIERAGEDGLLRVEDYIARSGGPAAGDAADD